MSLAVVVVGLTALLTWAAVALVPETLFFPVVEYSAPGEVRFTLLRNGELDRASCEQTAGNMGKSVRSLCPDCNPVERCFRGLDAEKRRILSRDPLDLPSVRTQGQQVTMTISAADPGTALSVCRLIEQNSAAQPIDKQAKCHPAHARR